MEAGQSFLVGGLGVKVSLVTFDLMENIDLVKFIATTYYLLIQRNEGAGSTGFLCHMLHVGWPLEGKRSHPRCGARSVAYS